MVVPAQQVGELRPPGSDEDVAAAQTPPEPLEGVEPLERGPRGNERRVQRADRAPDQQVGDDPGAEQRAQHADLDRTEVPAAAEHERGVVARTARPSGSAPSSDAPAPAVAARRPVPPPPTHRTLIGRVGPRVERFALVLLVLGTQNRTICGFHVPRTMENVRSQRVWLASWWSTRSPKRALASAIRSGRCAVGKRPSVRPSSP